MHVEKKGCPGWIVATDGFRSDFKIVQKIFYNCSPFLNYFEREFSGINVYSLNHESVREVGHSRLESSNGFWLQYIHSSNVANVFKHNKLISEAEFRMRNFCEDIKVNAMKTITLDHDWFRVWAGFDVPSQQD